MIIRERPGPVELLFALRGSILPRIAPELLVIALISTAIVAWDSHVSPLTHLSSTPFALFGVALSLFLGFRNNAAYDRWWEARKLLGGLVADSRAFAREAEVFLADEPTRHQLLRELLAFHHLNRCLLRGIAPDAAARKRDRQAGIRAMHPSLALDRMNATITEARAGGMLDGFGALALTRRMGEFAAGFTGCERILATPLPHAYSMLIYRTTWLYCLLLPLALLDGTGWMSPVFVTIVGYTFLGLAEVTEQLSNPFGKSENALPLDAICRNVEISLAPYLGETAPPPLLPVNYRLD